MAETWDRVPCSGCGASISVPPDWRLVECPSCGAIVTRMASDPRYD
ncbi:MAG TPA: hypothetical protein VEL82_01530 [Thermoplasmata archaeon]|nr:hypothetical protein [Thermoplasmata archaeon]